MTEPSNSGSKKEHKKKEKKSTGKGRSPDKVAKKKVVKKQAAKKRVAKKQVAARTTAPRAPSATPIQPISPRERYEMIARMAYFRAESRSFQPGNELDDWLECERTVDRMIGNNDE